MKHLFSLLLVFNLAIAVAQPCSKTPRIPFLNSDCQQIYNTVADTAPPPYAPVIVPFHNTDLYQIYCAIMADTAIATGLSSDSISSYAWSLTGNSGTNPETNFIGTTDGVGLVFKAYNTISARIFDDEFDNANTSFGYNALATNGSFSNTSFGAQALKNVTGPQNTAVGYGALLGNVNGTANTAIGLYSGGISLDSGSYNTFLGAESDAIMPIALRSTAIGHKALVGCDSCVVIGDTTATKGVGIGTAYPSAKLDVRGTVKIVDGTQGAGKFLGSDANGFASWKTVSVLLGTLPEYADDAAAAGGGVPVGGAYYNTTIHAYTKREA